MEQLDCQEIVGIIMDRVADYRNDKMCWKQKLPK